MRRHQWSALKSTCLHTKYRRDGFLFSFLPRSPFNLTELSQVTNCSETLTVGLRRRHEAFPLLVLGRRLELMSNSLFFKCLPSLCHSASLQCAVSHPCLAPPLRHSTKGTSTRPFLKLPFLQAKEGSLIGAFKSMHHKGRS